MRSDLRRFEVSRVSVGRSGSGDRGEESVGVVAVVESGEALESGDEGGFPHCITSLMSHWIIT